MIYLLTYTQTHTCLHTASLSLLVNEHYLCLSIFFVFERSKQLREISAKETERKKKQKKRHETVD